jgi:hypothetical protein
MQNAPSRARGPAPLWGATPPPPKVRKYDRIKVVNSTVLRFVLVNPRLEELNTHYTGRTVVCSETSTSRCWLDHREVGNPRYGAWLAVMYPHTLKVCILRLTAVSLAVEPRLRDQSIDLRGLTCEVWRQGSNEHCELHARLLVERERVEKLPGAIDLRFAVERMLEAEDRKARKDKPAKGLFGAAFAAQSSEQSV